MARSKANLIVARANMRVCYKSIWVESMCCGTLYECVLLRECVATCRGWIDLCAKLLSYLLECALAWSLNGDWMKQSSQCFWVQWFDTVNNENNIKSSKKSLEDDTQW